MAFLPQVFNVAFASNTTTASMTPALEIPGNYLYIYVVVPTMTSGYATASTPIYINGSADNATFYRFANTEATNNTLVAGINPFTIASSVSQRIVLVPNFSMRYLKLEVSGTVTNPTAMVNTFQIVCVSNQ